MNIVVKSLVKSIMEKKFRTFLVIFSIVISTGLFFASSSISSSLVEMYTNKLKSTVGHADLVVKNDENGAAPFFEAESNNSIDQLLTYQIGEIVTQGYVTQENKKTQWFTIHGIDLTDLNTISPYTLEKADTASFEGNQIVISRKMADTLGLAVGDNLEINIAGESHRLKVANAAYATGIFLDETASGSAVIPKSTMASILKSDNKVSSLHIKLNNIQDEQFVLDTLKSLYPDYIVKEPISKADLQGQIGALPTALYIMLIVVSFMSIFIIYTCFKVVAIERMPLIGTLRSIGITRKKANTILLVESTLYGVTGGVLGTAIGIAFLYAISWLTTPDFMRESGINLKIAAADVITAILFALLLCILSSLIPIIKSSRASIKSVVLQQIEQKPMKIKFNAVFGIIMIAISFISSFMVTGQLSIAVVAVSVILLGIAVTLLVPGVTQLFCIMSEKLYLVLFGNIGVIAVKNLKGNKNILNSISLLAIGISSLIFIQSASTSILSATSEIYKTITNYDIQMKVPGVDEQSLKQIANIEGVADAYGNYEVMNVEVEGKGTIQMIDSADKTKHLSYWNFDGLDSGQVYSELHSGRKIVLGTAAMQRLGVSKGDDITLHLPGGSFTYQVIANFDTLLSTGNIGIISEENLRNDGKFNYYTNIYVKASGDIESLANRLDTAPLMNKPLVLTTKEIEKGYADSNKMMFTVLQAFALLSMLIGLIGIVNNLIISFIERKMMIAMMRSIGLSKSQLWGMLGIESFTSGIIGGVVGCFGGFLFVSILPYVYKALYIPPVFIAYPVNQVFLYIVAAIIITVCSSISPIMKSSKMSIIKSIKFE